MKSLHVVGFLRPVPAGQSKVARQFIAGFKTKNRPRPIGTPEPFQHIIRRPYWIKSLRHPSPAAAASRALSEVEGGGERNASLSRVWIKNLRHPEEGERNASYSRGWVRKLRHPERGEGNASFSRGVRSSRVEGPTGLHRKCPQRINLASNQTAPPARREPEFPLVPNLRHREGGEGNASYSRGWVRNLRHPERGEGSASFSRSVRSSRVEGPTGLHRKCPQRIKLSLNRTIPPAIRGREVPLVPKLHVAAPSSSLCRLPRSKPEACQSISRWLRPAPAFGGPTPPVHPLNSPDPGGVAEPSPCPQGPPP
jgi:hypothetical protein